MKKISFRELSILISKTRQDEMRTFSLMTLNELIHYIDMQDIISEIYDIWEVTEFGKLTHLNYVGCSRNV